MIRAGGISAALLSVLLAASAGADRSPNVRIFDFTYTADLTAIPAGAQRLEVWIPYPQSDAHQTISAVKIDAPVPTRVTRDREYGNQILYVRVDRPKSQAMRIDLKFRVERRESVRRPPGPVKDGMPRDPMLARWLEPDRLVPIGGTIRDLALEVTQGKRTPLDRARAIYDYSVTTLEYDKSGTGWGRGDIYYACDVKRGNCTDFHAVFTGFARALGVPARFEIGFPLPPDRGEGEIAGYHCWSQFWLDGYGWVPVDASEANKNPDKREYFFGAHDENRVLLTLGRDIRLEPPQKGDPLNYFIYPYVEVDGKPLANVGRRFSFKDIPSGASVGRE